MPHVVIVGAGASGVALATQLAGRLRVTVVEPGVPGQGVAYRDTPGLLLNVPAARMSIDPGRPDDFARWLEAHQLPAAPYAERRWYGAYLAERFADACARGVQVLRATVLELQRDGAAFSLRLSTGQRVSADRVVLATGNALPRAPRTLVGTVGVVFDPWNAAALDAIAPTARVLVLGTGLTAVDVLAVLARRGHSGRVLALSRHGRFPLAHQPESLPDAEPIDPASLPRTTRALTRWLRDECARQRVPWQRVLNRFRPLVPTVWRSLPSAERARFLRVALPWWNIHRHRAPPELLDEARSLTALEVRAGRLERAHAHATPLQVTLKARGGASSTELFDHLVLATGPSFRTPLVEQVASAGLVAIDELGVRAQVEHLHILGPPARSEAFETTAVAEISLEARALAQRVVEA